MSLTVRLLKTAMAIAALLGAVFPWASAGVRGWVVQAVQPPTRWTTAVDPAHALPEYPRPQLVRSSWQSLNGLWDYTITPRDASTPSGYTGQILVPYPLESALSGVRRSLRADQLLWYRRSFQAPTLKGGERLLLHFGAVDYQATIYLNGRDVGVHIGGYQGFTFDISDDVHVGANELAVEVWDPTESGPNPHGKQDEYSPSSGIWQTVWLETVPHTYIDTLTVTPDVDRSRLNLRVGLRGESTGYVIEAIAKAGSMPVDRRTVSGATALVIEHPRLWSPDDPYLYDLEVRLLKDGRVIDEVTSYFGMRKVEVKQDTDGVERIFLNGRYTYNLGVLDQGFWPDGRYTAPTDAALKFDIQAAKAMGFNTIRKHIKVEPDRWYYYCDLLGVMVWQDMVNPAKYDPDKLTPEARAEFEKEVLESLSQLHNHPSITIWVLFNEGWGAYDQERLAHRIKELDPSRLLNAHTGPNQSLGVIAQWAKHLRDVRRLTRLMNGDFLVVSELPPLPRDDRPVDWVGGDLTDTHHYPDPELPPAVPGKARVLGEHGGIGAYVENHLWNDTIGFGYKEVPPKALTNAYARIVDQLNRLEAQGLSGSIFTQLYDVESEQNGLLTYDRAVTKIPVARISGINARLVPTAKIAHATTRGFVIADMDLTPEAARYAVLLAQYHRGKRSSTFLRHLTLMAISQHDQAHATEAGNAYIDRLSQPYSLDSWTFIRTVTRTSHDKGFNLLRSQGERANAFLGSNAAEAKIREVINREEIEPSLAGHLGIPDWTSIETKVGGKYGDLGEEAVNGAEMMYYREKEDWLNFGTHYAKYFATASSRSEYPTGNLSYAVFVHIGDRRVLESAIKAVAVAMQSNNLDTFGPAGTDTYANLLYKVGRTREAIDLEQSAARASKGRNREIMKHLDDMLAGRPTWP